MSFCEFCEILRSQIPVSQGGRGFTKIHKCEFCKNTPPKIHIFIHNVRAPTLMCIRVCISENIICLTQCRAAHGRQFAFVLNRTHECPYECRTRTCCRRQLVAPQQRTCVWRGTLEAVVANAGANLSWTEIDPSSRSCPNFMNKNMGIMST